MKQFYVIEVDSEDSFAFVHKVERSFSSTVDYKRKPEDAAVICSLDLDAKFYGQLHSLFITQASLTNAAPIEPEGLCSQPK